MQASSPDPAPPAYTVRVSPRARRVRLVVSARDGLVVVVPRRFPVARIAPIVEERRAWVARALERVREQRETLEAGRALLPDRVDLPGIGESWPVEYRATDASGVRCATRDGVLRVTGAVCDRGAVHAALVRAARSRAAEALPAMLSAVSAEQSLPFAAVRVRAQRTRWGSCSARGHISLNWRLAFLPRSLARHVMVHELVHTLRHDHSRVFHGLLAEREPDAALHARELRAAWRHVPGWAVDG